MESSRLVSRRDDSIGVSKRLAADVNEIAKTLNLLAQPSQVIELRLLVARPNGYRAPVTMSGFFDDYSKLATAAASVGSSARGVYITLNPVNPALFARSANRLQVADKTIPLTSDSDITRRCWLPIDFDPVRPAGISSTDEEHEAAIQRAYLVRDTLGMKGWPDPIVADSGNGAHLLYAVELPAHDGGTVKRCLQALAHQFDDGAVKIDQAVFNPARIWKLYGTVSRKGDDVPERPYRLSRLLEAPC